MAVIEACREERFPFPDGTIIAGLHCRKVGSFGHRHPPVGVDDLHAMAVKFSLGDRYLGGCKHDS
jgi:hypothetical protein